jgi:DNA-binding transcriptional MocR family regulator
MIVELDRNDNTPLYRQLKCKLSGLIVQRLLLPGSKLPATRELAATIGVSRNTVVQAYQELEIEGLITSKVGSGAFVSQYLFGGFSSQPAEQQSVMSYEGLISSTWLRSNANLISIFTQLSRPEGKTQLIDLASDQPESRLLPVGEFGQCLQSAVRRYGAQLFTSGLPSGFEPLLEYLPTLLARRNIPCQMENLMVVSGLQQALTLIGRLFVDPGDTVLLQHLTYPGAIGVFRALQASCVGIPMDDEGLCIEVLERVLRHRKPKLLYIVPTFHNPTGTTMAAERRRRLVELCRQSNVLIIEDDYAHDLVFEGGEPIPLKAWDTSGGIIHLGSFSESLFPGIRLSWIVATTPIIERLALLKQSFDLYTNRILQGALLEYCRKGYYEKGLKRKRQVLKRRRDAMIHAMESHFPGEVKWQKPGGGLYQWVDIPEEIDALDVLLKTRTKGVVFSPDRLFAVEEWSRGGFRLGFATAEEEQISPGVQIIGEALKEILVSNGFE